MGRSTETEETPTEHHNKSEILKLKKNLHRMLEN